MLKPEQRVDLKAFGERLAQLDAAVGSESHLSAAFGKLSAKEIEEAQSQLKRLEGQAIDPILSGRSQMIETCLKGGRPPCSPEAWEKTLGYCKTLRLQLSSVDEALEMMAAANALAVPEMGSICEEYLARHITASNWPTLFEEAGRFDATDLFAHCCAFYLANFDRNSTEDCIALELPTSNQTLEQGEEAVRNLRLARYTELPPRAPFGYVKQPADMIFEDARGNQLPYHRAVLKVIMPDKDWIRAPRVESKGLDDSETVAQLPDGVSFQTLDLFRRST
jgi:hypothetical protein